MAELEEQQHPLGDPTPQIVDHRDKPPTVWRRVVEAGDCVTCHCCGEAYCSMCDDHYVDCECPGPHQDDLYEYREYFGALYAREKTDGTRKTH